MRLRVRPSLHFRGHDDAVDVEMKGPYRVSVVDNRFEITPPAPHPPPLRMRFVAPHAGLFHYGGSMRHLKYRVEKARGYAYSGSLWSPGYFYGLLESGDQACLIASTEPWDAILAAEPHLRTPRFVECHRLAPYRERGTDVNVVLDLMIHDIDIVQTIVGAPVTRIDAVGTPVFSEEIDIANARIHFANGCVANATASLCAGTLRSK